MRWEIQDLLRHCSECQTGSGDVWYPARPVNWKHQPLSWRVRNAWLVLTGKADAVVWPGNQ